MTEQTNLATKPKQILTSAETAAFLGISLSYLEKLTSRRMIPYSKPGGKLRYFRLEDVIAWATRNRIATIDEINSEAQAHIIR